MLKVVREEKTEHTQVQKSPCREHWQVFGSEAVCSSGSFLKTGIFSSLFLSCHQLWGQFVCDTCSAQTF